MSFIIKNIQMTLDPDSIKAALEQVEDIENRIHPAMNHLINKLVEKGVEIAKAELIFFSPPAYYTGQLSDSIQGIPESDGVGIIRTDCDYAVYVEYGTGWGFDEGNEDGVGRSGKPIHQMYGWWYLNDRDGKWHSTDGMAARPFMHHTYEDLIREVEASGGRIVAEYLAGDDGA